MADNPFRISIYDKDFVRQGWLGDPEALEVTTITNCPARN